jgi:hypothetical protein
MTSWFVNLGKSRVRCPWSSTNPWVKLSCLDSLGNHWFIPQSASITNACLSSWLIDQHDLLALL